MRYSLSGRSWGDGHTTRSRHIVADIQFGSDSSALRCEDGAVLHSDTPAGLEALWVEHGGASIDTRSKDRRPDEGAEWSEKSLAIIRFMGLHCSCTVDSDIKDCPNYLAEDDELLPEDDE